MQAFLGYNYCISYILIVYVPCWDLQVNQELEQDQHIARLQEDAVRMQEQLMAKEQQNQELQHELAIIVRGVNQSPGIHTGGREMGDFPPPPPPFRKSPPPLLNQPSKVVLKHKQQQSDKCCSKKVCICSKTPITFPKVYSSCQTIAW